MHKTMIQISNQTWKKLNDYKTPDEKTFEDVIKRLIKREERNETKESI